MTARIWLALALIPCTPGWALESGDTVYVRARNTKLLKEPRANAPAGRTLNVGEALTWRKAEAGNFHEVQPTGEKKAGFVYYANLALKPPREERWAASNTTTDVEDFGSSGAATKGLAQGAVQLAATDASLARAATALKALELLQAGITDDELDAQLLRSGQEARK
ncbi:MAG: hypothetical protein RL653_4535 [Pseudomonadota bacterium]|jgi:hypothetical protein